MKISLEKSQNRGHVKHGWLDSYHSFSFGNYYNPDKMGFGKLRVINDDIIAAGSGFGKHPHQNMEIITIMLSGILKHQDSMGNEASIRAGEIQVMSAGTGVYHSEFNGLDDKEANLLQIWVEPNRLNVTPRYDQKTIKDLASRNQLYQILSPNPEGQGVWIYQDAWFYLGEFDSETKISYKLNKQNNGVYIFVIDGGLNLEKYDLEKRDALEITETDKIDFTAKKDSKILLIEVPI